MIRSVMLVANCHCLPLADAFALCVPGVRTDFIDVNFAQTADNLAKIAGLAASKAEIVFTQMISERLGSVATSILRRQLGVSGVVTFTNIHFTGLHPDITYLGGMGQRLQSPLGDYHSKLVLFSYASQRSLKDCLALFTGPTYERIGYFTAFEQSAGELLARDVALDVRFAEAFITMARKVPTLYTINHPTGTVFLALANALASYAGLPFLPWEPAMFQNHLSINYIWPVYNEIAEHNQLAFRTPLVFVRKGQRDSRVATLREFVSGCYAAYAEADFSQMQRAVVYTPFYMDFAERLGI